MIYFRKYDLGIEQDREVFAPLSTKLVERGGERGNELLIDESDIKLWIVADDRLARVDQRLDYSGKAYLTLVNFFNLLAIFVSESFLNLASSL